MSFNLGQFTMFDDLNSVMDPVISVLAKAVNLGANKGAIFNSLNAPSVAITQEKFDIYSRSQTSRNTFVGSTGWDISATTGLTVVSAGVNGLTVGCVLKVESEVVIVKSVDRSANTIDVFGRGLGGTTAATHAIGVAIASIGFAAKPTDLKNVESMSENTLVYNNYIQTIYEIIEYTERSRQLARQGVPQGQIVLMLQQEAMLRVARNLSTSAVNGVKQLGTSSIPYMTAGLYAQLADDASGTRPVLSVDASGVALTEDILRGACQEGFANGNPDTIWVNARNKEIINGFEASTSSLIRQADSNVRGVNVDSFNYENQILSVKVDTDNPDTEIAIVNSSKCYKGWMKDNGLRSVEEPPVTSEENRESIKGAYGIMIEDVGYEHVLLTNLG